MLRHNESVDTARTIPVVAGLSLVIVGVGIAIGQSQAWPFAIAALVMGVGLAYSGWSKRTIRKLGAGGVELDPRELVQEVDKQLAEATRGQIDVRVPAPTSEARAVVVTPDPARLSVRAYPPTVHISASDSGTGSDAVSVEKYEQLAMFAGSTAELAKVLVDFIEAKRRGLADAPIADETGPEESGGVADSRTDSRTDS